ncbi:MAG: hypothetical protein U0797_04645 [Gemmataceae bacterium]
MAVWASSTASPTRPWAARSPSRSCRSGSAPARRRRGGSPTKARITAQLQHPNIPAVHDLGTLHDGRPFLAMKLVKGLTLDRMLARPDPASRPRPVRHGVREGLPGGGVRPRPGWSTGT